MNVTLSKKLNMLLAFAVGVMAANLYYAQPLTALIAKSLGLDPSVAGLVVTLTQAGYGLGVLFLVPLGDLLENRKIILTLITMAMAALIGLGLVTSLFAYFTAALLLGIGTSAIQIIVPYATHLSDEKVRGQVVGSLMSGVMLGIMLSRPTASILTDLFSWHAVFYFSALVMLFMAITLYFNLPIRKPNSANLHYGKLIASMGKLFFRYSLLRRRAIYQACMFGAFCLFWTATPLLLAGPEFHMSQTGIAIFALAGVTGAIFAPLAGKMADRGHTQMATTLAFVAGAFSFLLTHFTDLGSTISLVLLTLSAILLDAGVSANLVLGQRAIFSLSAEYRGRFNSLYIATIFIGGSFGSFIGAWAYDHGHWNLTSWIGFAMPAIGLLYFLTEVIRRSPDGGYRSPNN